MSFRDSAGNEITYPHNSLDCPDLLPPCPTVPGASFTCTCGRVYMARHVWPGAPVMWHHTTPPVDRVMISPFHPERTPARSHAVAAGRRASIPGPVGVPLDHETALRLALMAAGFTRPDRDTFMAAWDRAEGDLTPDELMLFQRHYSHSARDLGDAL